MVRTASQSHSTKSKLLEKEKKVITDKKKFIVLCAMCIHNSVIHYYSKPTVNQFKLDWIYNRLSNNSVLNSGICLLDNLFAYFGLSFIFNNMLLSQFRFVVTRYINLFKIKSWLINLFLSVLRLQYSMHHIVVFNWCIVFDNFFGHFNK